MRYFCITLFSFVLLLTVVWISAVILPLAGLPADYVGAASVLIGIPVWDLHVKLIRSPWAENKRR